MERRRLSLTVIASLGVGAILVIALGIFLVVGLRAGRFSSRQRMVKDNRALLSLSTDLMFDPLYELDIWTLEGMLNKFVGEADIVRAVVRDVTGENVVEVAVEESAFALEEQASQDMAAQALAQSDIVERESRGYLILCGPIATGAQQVGTLEIVVDLTPFRASMAPMVIAMSLTTVMIIAVGILAVVLLARRAASFANMLIDAAENIGRGNLDTSVPIRGPSETATLGKALNQMRLALKELYADIEQQAKAQERRARHLQVAAEVARGAAVELDVSTLLQRVVTLIDERFEFSRQGVFLMDADGEWAMLQAASGEAVGSTLESDFRLRVGEEGAVGHVAEIGEVYVIEDVTGNPYFVSDTDVVDIRSEAAFPLQARGEIIGVLDVQSTEVDAFSEGDVAALQILADQVALAISNARLFQQAQENLERAQRAYGELSREAWAEILHTQPELGYYCDAGGVVPAKEHPGDYGDEALPEFSVPVVVRDNVIGTIKAHKPSDSEGWTREEISLIEVLAEQLGVALESARLYQDTQRRAARERLTSEITARMRETLDMETVLQTTIRELGSALDVSKIKLRMSE